MVWLVLYTPDGGELGLAIKPPKAWTTLAAVAILHDAILLSRPFLPSRHHNNHGHFDSHGAQQPDDNALQCL
jgi:hypothetical protein